jgi:hypothetical protein
MKRIKKHKITIKRMKTKLDTKIKWNQIIKNEIEKKKSTEKSIKSKINSN